ncbi:MAG: ATP-binding protein [Bacteroidaceae bacterium]|nr:ATP-binding protein [Bacteroidaceae bacterium]
MHYLRRKIDSYLTNWKEDKARKPLVIKGARQIGKTEAVINFAQKHYSHIVKINFAEEPKYKAIVQDGYSTEAILKNITKLNPLIQFEEGQTLIFFDELQEFPDIATSLKFFNIDGRYDVICSGSLLGLHYHQIEHNSVGYKVDYDMHSMDFEEFLWAKGYESETIEEMYLHLVERTPFSMLEHELYLSIFRDFCITGGMPEIVSRYVERGTFEGVLEMQQQLVRDYKEDVRKYAQGIEQTRIINVFNRIPVQLAQDNKKFQISKVASGAKSKDYWGCIEWLQDAGIINICYCLNFPELPLKGNYDDSKYKLYYADTGLLIAQLDEEAQEDLRANQNLGTYKGALYENFVAEALRKSGAELFYYKRQDSTLEEDFFMRTRNSLVPIEVKSNKGQSQSMRTLIESNKYTDITWGIKLTAGNVGFANNILTLPYFCTFLLKRYLKSIE